MTGITNDELADDIAAVEPIMIRLPGCAPTEVVTLTMSLTSRDHLVKVLRANEGTLTELRTRMFRQLGSDADHEDLRATWQEIDAALGASPYRAYTAPTVEDAAKLIYDAIPYVPYPGDPATKPAWVEAGNSQMQAASRRAACAVLALSPKGSSEPPPNAGEGPGPSTFAATHLASPSASRRGEPAPGMDQPTNTMAENQTLRELLADERANVRRLTDALRPFANSVYNDNGDMTVTPCDRAAYTKAYSVMKPALTGGEQPSAMASDEPVAQALFNKLTELGVINAEVRDPLRECREVVRALRLTSGEPMDGSHR